MLYCLLNGICFYLVGCCLVFVLIEPKDETDIINTGTWKLEKKIKKNKKGKFK
jgi:hypothetical protein